LYKDQVVELVNRAVAPFFPREAALTDTMVNNYVKLRVITPPVRKRYNRDQLAQLILVCLLKRVLSIAQLRRLLELARSGGSTERGYPLLRRAGGGADGKAVPRCPGGGPRGCAHRARGAGLCVQAGI
jgi:DNA-binding transcriptional MerR regulator